MSNIPRTEPKASAQVLKTLTDDEVERLHEHLQVRAGCGPAPYKNARNRVMILLMLDAGLRVGELVRLQRDTLYVSSVPVTSIIIVCEKKKKHKTRQIPLSVRLSDALTIFWVYLCLLDINAGGDKVFLRGPGKSPITTRQVQRIVRAAGRDAIGRNVWPHILRHTFATRLMRIAPARVVQELLGHENLSSTQIYQHPNGEDLKKAIDGLNNASETKSSS